MIFSINSKEAIKSQNVIITPENTIELYQEFLKMLDDFEQNYFLKYGIKPFNKKQNDPFHLFSSDANPLNIPKITNSLIPLYFPTPECYTCSGPDPNGPRPCKYKNFLIMINNKLSCKMWIHRNRNPKQPHKDPFVESRATYGTKITLSRYTMVWLLDHPEINFIVRGTKANHIIFHHTKMDKYYDAPGTIKIGFDGWHKNIHSEYLSFIISISKFYEVGLITLDESESLREKIDFMFKDSLTDDPLVMTILNEMNKNFII